jgi:hypothetical protein
MLFSLSLWQQSISPWSLDRNPICVRALARERLVYLQGCNLRKDESSLNFTLLFETGVFLSFLSFSSSCWREYSNIVRSYSPGSCILPVFQTLGVLDSWDLAVFFDSCGLSWLLRTSRISQFFGLFMVL